eukprot:2419173-Pleurochrysis_carterae.AAC.1
MPSIQKLGTFMMMLRSGKNTRGGRGLVKKSAMLSALLTRHGDVVRFHFLAHEEVAPINVLGALMVLGVVRQVNRTFIVHRERSRSILRQPKFSKECAQVYGFLGRFGRGNYLGLTRGKCDASLLLGGPDSRIS